MRQDLDFARAEARAGRPQAIVLSSPTGSGKTVTVTALMEWLLEGHDEFPPDSQAVFLWISDSPELNKQSRDKIRQQSSRFEDHDLVVVEPPFSREQFDAGKVYFLNTQKLGKDSLLTKAGDGRDFTIWQTIESTATAKPSSFYVIIDEAHRGMMEKKRERVQAATIIQRFIKGYPEGGMQAVRLIIGMSATPERFSRIIEGSGRTKRECLIDPEDVKDSGLLKDKIVIFHPDEKQPADWTLLEQAVQRWKLFGREWRKYCDVQDIHLRVEPVLVVQVQDGTKGQLTKTDLGEVVKIIERITGPLPDAAWAHAFQEDRAIELDGRKIRKIEASQIEFDPDVKIVLFKMSLTTGWDCPRAEVMMSFRRAQDNTLIAQLVGRMVRTPLARTIEGQDFLNSVSLYLPHYDRAGLKLVLDKLNTPDPESGPLVDIEDGTKLIQLNRDPTKAKLFDRLEQLPSYRIERIQRVSNVRRLMKLARRLTFDEIEETSLDEAKKLIVKTLSSELVRLSKRAEFVGNLAANQEIEVRELWVEYGEWQELDASKTIRVKATPENIDDLFEQCGRKLGEGLHWEFWRAKKDGSDPLYAKLALYGVLQEKGVWARLERVCLSRLDELFKKHNDAIKKLPTGKRENYNRIRRIAKEPESETLTLPSNLEVKFEEPNWERHLYVDTKGNFGAKFNSWESDALKGELARKDVVGWVRNVPRKLWSFCVPYQSENEWRPLYPDFIVFRTEAKKLVVDILDPHDTGLRDAVDKAKGLASFARKHGDHFGRIELIMSAKKEIKRLDLTRESVRAEVDKIGDRAHLDRLFEELG